VCDKKLDAPGAVSNFVSPARSNFGIVCSITSSIAMSAYLLAIENTLSMAGYSRSIVLGGPQPLRQAMGVVLGDLADVTLDAYAVGALPSPKLPCTGALLMTLPPIALDRSYYLKDRMASVTRASLALFSDAHVAGVESLGIGVPEPIFFGDLDNAIAVRLILGAADIFWRIHSQSILKFILVAVDTPEFLLSF
jgi:hypothetical protein